MRKKGLSLFSVIALVAIFALVTTVASAAKNKAFILKSAKSGSSALSLTKPSGGEIANVAITQTGTTIPTIKLTYSKLRNSTLTTKPSIVITFTSAADKRTVNIRGSLTIKVNKSGSKITKVTPGTFAYDGTTSSGAVVGGSLTATGAFKASGKTLSIVSNTLISSLTGKIGTIGKTAGSYTWTFEITKMPQKYKSASFSSLGGTLTVQ